MRFEDPKGRNRTKIVYFQKEDQETKKVRRTIEVGNIYNKMENNSFVTFKNGQNIDRMMDEVNPNSLLAPDNQDQT